MITEEAIAKIQEICTAAYKTEVITPDHVEPHGVYYLRSPGIPGAFEAQVRSEIRN